MRCVVILHSLRDLIISDVPIHRPLRRWGPFPLLRLCRFFVNFLTIGNGRSGKHARSHWRRSSGITRKRVRNSLRPVRAQLKRTPADSVLTTTLSHCNSLDRVYTSIDPAPPSASSGLMSGKPRPTGVDSNDISALKSTLLDTSRPLFERYRAMFALRNLGTPGAVDALASGFADDSALFKCVFIQQSFAKCF